MESRELPGGDAALRLVETEEQSLEDYILENFTVSCLTTPIDPETITPTPIPTPEPYDYDNLVIE